MKTEVIKEFLVGLGFKIDDAGMARFISGISKATVAVTAMGAATTAAAGAIFAGINSVAAEYYQLERLALQFRSTAEAVDQFIDSAQVLGIKNEVAIDSLQSLDRAIVDTSMGIGRTKLVFENLGISVVDAAGKIKPTTQVLGELAELFKTMERGKQLRVMERLGIDSSFVKIFMADLGTINADLDAIDKSVGLDFDKAIKEGKAFTLTFRELQKETQKWRVLFAKAMDVIAIKMMPRIRQTMENTRESMIRLRRMAMDVMPVVISKIEPIISAIIRIAEAFISISSRIASAVALIIALIIRLNSATNGWAGYIMAAAAAWRYLNLAFLRTPLGQIISLATALALLIDDFLTFREGGDSLIDWGGKFGVVMKVVTGSMALFLAGVVATKTWVAGVTIATNAWAVAVGALNGVLGAVRAATLLFNMALSLNPIGAVVVAIGALIGAGVMLVKNWDSVKQWFMSFFSFLNGGFQKASGFAGKVAGLFSLGGMRQSVLTPSPQTQATMTARAQSVNQRTQIVVNGNADPASTARAVAGATNTSKRRHGPKYASSSKMSIFDYELATFIPKRAIGSFNATVTIEESGRDEIEITQHPVQNGASISDHSFIKPTVLALSVMWDASTAPLNEIYLKLIKLQRTREPMDVVTGKRIYKNMLIRAISQTTDATTENALKINLELQEVIITYLEVTSVPDRKKQATPAKTGQTQNTGTKSASTASAPRKRSALFALTRG